MPTRYPDFYFLNAADPLRTVTNGMPFLQSTSLDSVVDVAEKQGAKNGAGSSIQAKVDMDTASLALTDFRLAIKSALHKRKTKETTSVIEDHLRSAAIRCSHFK